MNHAGISRDLAGSRHDQPGFFWMAFWVFILGYLVSSLIQVLVARERMQQTVVGPQAAFFTFIGSMGNIPLLAGEAVLSLF